MFLYTVACVLENYSLIIELNARATAESADDV